MNKYHIIARDFFTDLKQMNDYTFCVIQNNKKRGSDKCLFRPPAP